MVTKASEAPAPNPKEAVMYIGPTKMGALHVTNGAVFKGGVLPEHLAKAARARGNESFKTLFVPVSGAGKARAALRDPNSDPAKAFRAAAALEG
ncbi:hypothetical protein LF599_04640 [Pseudodesulfovibrio thermohalotolerans]|uniref:hypothetical protein n=1 Tax=Pseudodesulfovibrio thermohalotolerans TaxID=2880651 RepID=UPI0022B9F65F|nr:hypothetical protein [Pseudodesulfovibrio thermohalotolerans]WFS63456.1 hypothetical protein LF599_04640 [Pseudodesulfovibrio thermohalotolerans]